MSTQIDIPEWEESEAAVRLLAELDAVERASDACIGRGWTKAAEAHSERAQEIAGELDDLRSAAIKAAADATGHEPESDAWFDAWDDADMLATSVERAANAARRCRAGDALLEQAA